jgi:hypothetical protein
MNLLKKINTVRYMKLNRMIFGFIVLLLTSCAGNNRESTDAESASINKYASSGMLPDSTVSRLYGDYKWMYREADDEMSGKAIKIAKVYTKETFYLSEPYFGENKGMLIVRHHARYGNDIMISVKHGILLRDYVNVRFDNRPMKKFYTNEAADGDYTTLFIDRQKEFLKELLQSDSVRVEVRFYQDRPVILRFNVTGLRW